VDGGLSLRSVLIFHMPERSGVLVCADVGAAKMSAATMAALTATLA